MKILKVLQNVWLWTVAVVFTIAGFTAFCAFIGLIVIGIQKLIH
jgi:hypothetical protein